MRKVGYEIQNGVSKGCVVWTLKDKKVCEAAGDILKTKLFNLPEKRYFSDFKPWVAVNGKLVRQHV